MALTREFKETVVARARRDAKFRDRLRRPVGRSEKTLEEPASDARRATPDGGSYVSGYTLVKSDSGVK
jgi:hypothetical protein